MCQAEEKQKQGKYKLYKVTTVKKSKDGADGGNSIQTLRQRQVSTKFCLKVTGLDKPSDRGGLRHTDDWRWRLLATTCLRSPRHGIDAS
jgi:hypothetical protein